MSKSDRSRAPWKYQDRIVVDADGKPVTGIVPSRMKPEDLRGILSATSIMPRTMNLVRALIASDDDKRCPFCSKKEWGEDLHDEGCIYKEAYEIMSLARMSKFVSLDGVGEKEQSNMIALLSVVKLARKSIDVSLIRTSKRAQEHWESVANAIDIVLEQVEG